jgi:hypothetical protein
MDGKWAAILASAVISLLTSALYNEWRERRAMRRDITFRLYEEWHSRDMLKARLLTSEMLGEVSGASLTALQELMAKQSEDWIAVSLVIHYFERLGRF